MPPGAMHERSPRRFLDDDGTSNAMVGARREMRGGSASQTVACVVIDPDVLGCARHWKLGVALETG
jgi:hypothetical protein